MTAYTSMTGRMKGAALLDPAIYDEVEADAAATGQALAVVLMVAVAQAIGLAGVSLETVITMIAGMASAVLGWLVMAVPLFLLAR